MEAIRNIIALKSEDNQYRLSINAYKGKAYMSIFKDNMNIPISIWLSNTIQYLLNQYIVELIKNPQPSTTNSIFINKYDENTKSVIKQAILTVYTDEKGLIGISVTMIAPNNPNTPQELINTPIKFLFKMPPLIETDKPLEDRQKNIQAAKIFLHILNTKLSVAEMMTNQEQNGNGSSSTPVSADNTGELF